MHFGSATTTWTELEERSRRLAGALAERGVRAGDRVLLVCANRPEFVETMVAVHRLGAVLVPVNFRLAAPEIDHIAVDCGATVLVSDAAVASVLAGTDLVAQRGVPNLVIDTGAANRAGENYEQALSAAEPYNALGPEDLTALALIMYTSGTTGRPKGAMLTYQNLLTQTITAMGVLRLVEPDEVAAITSPFFHIASIGHIVPSLMLGHTMVVVETGAFNPEAFLDLLERHRVTSAFLVPTLWSRVCEAQQVRPRDLALRGLAWGAEPATEHSLDLMASTFPDASICSSFGQTEMSPITLVVTGGESRRNLRSVGRPVPLVEVQVIDEDGRQVAIGEVGEIVYRGPGTMIGYWNDPAATEEAFRGGWFHSGDLVRVDEEGYYYVVDRLKDMIISGGENIYSAEIEHVLMAHPAVRAAAVVGAPHPRWGETPVAFVVPADGEALPDPAVLSDFCTARLARYKRPSEVIVVDDLPRNAAGKVRKSDLRADLLSR